MLLENPCQMGKSESKADPLSLVLNRDEQYYDDCKKAKEVENARVLAEAEPIVSAVERRLHQEHLFTRVLIETGIKEEVLRALLDRRLPQQGYALPFTEESRRAALAALAVWLSEDKKRRSVAPDHAPTPTLKAIYSILVETMDCGLLNVIVGNYGIGKSRAAEVLVEERPRSRHTPGAVLIELRREDNTVSKCIGTMLKRLRHDSHGEGGYDELCRLLRHGDLLIVDEAQRLATCGGGAMVEVIRDLWKDTGAGIAIIGNPVMKKGGDGIVGNDLYGAFLSRAELHDFTKGNTRADVEAWMLWKGLSGKPLAEKLVALATRSARGEFGGLRELEKIVALAERRYPGEPITADLVLEALKLRSARS